MEQIEVKVKYTKDTVMAELVSENADELVARINGTEETFRHVGKGLYLSGEIFQPGYSVTRPFS